MNSVHLGILSLFSFLIKTLISAQTQQNHFSSKTDSHIFTAASFGPLGDG